MVSLLLSFLSILFLTVLAGLLVWASARYFEQYSDGDASTVDLTSQAKKPASKTREGAIVCCNGIGPEKAKERYLYEGISSCKLAHHTAGGFKECAAGCLSLGDCARACPLLAIDMVEGAPIIDLAMCDACGQCVIACPRNIIKIVPMHPQYNVGCMSHEQPSVLLKGCSVGCTACGKCLEVCEYGAIIIADQLAEIDPMKCVACGDCVKVCPQHVINYVDSTVTLVNAKPTPASAEGCATCEI
jgi:ferredoxin